MPSSSCDCFKKLQSLGVPYYSSDVEEEDAGEFEDVLSPGKAVVFPKIIQIRDCASYPVVEETDLHLVFQKMSDVITDLADYELNMFSFWALDIFIESLHTAQQAGMGHKHQHATLLWVAFVFNFLQINNIPRREVFKKIWSMIIFPPELSTAGKSEKSEEGEQVTEFEGEDSSGLLEVWEIPLPPKLDMQEQEGESSTSSLAKEGLDTSYDDLESDARESSLTQTTESKGEWTTETNLKHMNVILEILYRIFGHFDVFKQILMTFHQTPNTEIIQLPFQIPKLIPKPILKLSPLKSTKTGIFEISSDEAEADRQLHKHDFILPLEQAEGAKQYVLKLFGISSSESVLSAQKKEKPKKK